MRAIRVLIRFLNVSRAILVFSKIYYYAIYNKLERK